MTKFCYASDLHLEFGELVINNTGHADCLILAGDVVPAADLRVKSDMIPNHIDTFFKNISEQFETIIWVPGNHEFYDSSLQTAPEIIKDYIEKSNIGNIKFLQNETILINNVPVHCGTLWTNMNNLDQEVLYHASHRMSDYRAIKNNISGKETLLRPVDTVNEHLNTMLFLDSAITEKCIVVTHHAPLEECLKYSDRKYDHFYFSDLKNFILERPQIEYWIHGHVHNRKDIQVSNTIVTSNCRGYKGHEDMADYFTLQYFEMD